MGVLTESMMRLRDEIHTWSQTRLALQSDLVRQTAERRHRVSAMCTAFALDRAGAQRAWYGPKVAERRSALQRNRQPQQVAAATAVEDARSQVEAARARAEDEARRHAEAAEARADEEARQQQARTKIQGEEEARRQADAAQPEAEQEQDAPELRARPQRQKVTNTASGNPLAAHSQPAPRSHRKGLKKH